MFPCKLKPPLSLNLEIIKKFCTTFKVSIPTSNSGRRTNQKGPIFKICINLKRSKADFRDCVWVWVIWVKTNLILIKKCHIRLLRLVGGSEATGNYKYFLFIFFTAACSNMGTIARSKTALFFFCDEKEDFHVHFLLNFICLPKYCFNSKQC